MDQPGGSTVISDPLMLRAAERWNRKGGRGPGRWWQNAQVLRHVNEIVCGESCDGKSEGVKRRLSQVAPAGGFARGVSVACGTGDKEMALVQAGIVGHFDLYELSENRVRIGVENAERLGLAGRITFHVADALADDTPERFDLVYWNNALHHMLDVPGAVEWSWRVLRLGGAFALDDFIGATRFQWTDEQLRLIHQMRRTLPERLLADRENPGASIPVQPVRPDEFGFFRADPSEAADSERTLPAVRKYFPGAEIILTGGIFWQAGLARIIGNFGSDGEDSEVLARILREDRALADAGVANYAVVLAEKRGLTPEQLSVPLPDKRPLPSPPKPTGRDRIRRTAGRVLARIRKSRRG